MSIDAIIKEFNKYNQSENEANLIRRAFELARTAHEGQKRKGGEPYITHPLSVGLTLAKMRLDAATIAAGLLHDTVEDCGVPLSEIEKKFGTDIAFLVDGVTKVGHIRYRGAEKQIENLRKMFLAMARDIRVVLIKLADRHHNMQTLDALPPDKRRRIALETAEIYAPIAHRLGIGELRGQLEDLAFKHIHPKEYEWVLKNIGEKYQEREDYLKKLIPFLISELNRDGIEPIEIQYRAKHYYSLYKKLLKYDMNFDRIYDLAACRILVPSVEKCYGVLGTIHRLWKPLPGMIKDYIAMPKPNGYKSLHTTVFCVNGKIMEFQIRTPEMHQENEYGIAAHFAYKENTAKPNAEELTWVKQLREWQKESQNPDEVLENLKIDFFKRRIFVLTPRGEVMDLPEESTPVDFAYQVHSELGDQCVGAKVNNKIAPLDYKLKSGDIVEILTQKNKKPSASWLEFVKTSEARKKIKNAVNKKERNISVEPQKKNQPIELKITTQDRVGLLKDITKAVASFKINILNVNMDNKSGAFPIIAVSIVPKDKAQLERLIVKIKQIKGVLEISSKA